MTAHLQNRHKRCFLAFLGLMPKLVTAKPSMIDSIVSPICSILLPPYENAHDSELGLWP